MIFVDFCATIPGEEIRETKKYIDLTWFDGLPTSTGIWKKTFIMSRIKVT